MTRSRVAGLAVCVAALVLLGVWSAGTGLGSLPVAAGAPRPGEVAFTFNPPDRTTFVETAQAHMLTDLGGIVRQRQTLTAQTRYVLSRSGSGYTLTATILSFDIRNDTLPAPPALGTSSSASS